MIITIVTTTSAPRNRTVVTTAHLDRSEVRLGANQHRRISYVLVEAARVFRVGLARPRRERLEHILFATPPPPPPPPPLLPHPRRHHLDKLVELDLPRPVGIDVGDHPQQLLLLHIEPKIPHRCPQLAVVDRAGAVTVEEVERLAQLLELLLRHTALLNHLARGRASRYAGRCDGRYGDRCDGWCDAGRARRRAGRRGALLRAS